MTAKDKNKSILHKQLNLLALWTFLLLCDVINVGCFCLADEWHLCKGFSSLCGGAEREETLSAHSTLLKPFLRLSTPEVLIITVNYSGTRFLSLRDVSVRE